jgi:O-succinylbenzoate synthase
MSSPIIVNARVYRFQLPLIRPFNIGPSTITMREGLLLRCTDDKGVDAWGEASPLPGFSKDTLAEAELELKVSAREWARPSKSGKPDKGWSSAAVNASVQVRMWHTILATPAMPSVVVEIAALLEGDGDKLLRGAAQAAERGYRAAKLKVGRKPLEEEISLTREVRTALGPNCRLRLDANRAWSLDDARIFLQGITRSPSEYHAPIDYLEEPLRSPGDRNVIRNEFGIPIALDETLIDTFGKGPSDKQRIPLADFWVWKPSCWALPYHLAPGEKLPPRILSAVFESGVATALMGGLAAGSGRPAGLDTYNCLADDVLEERLPLDQPKVLLKTLLDASRRVDVSRLELLHEYTR